MADDGDFEFDDLESVFKSATDYVRRISGKLDSEKLLYFYARFKQANEGKCNTSKPSFFDFQGKAKWDAWNKLGDMNKKQAMMEYISLLTNIEQEWRGKMNSEVSDENAQPTQRQAFGVTVSTMANTEEELSAEEKSIFDWCKEGNVDMVKEMLANGSANVNGVDEEGLSLLHWASDRGLTSMVELLLSRQAEINIKDVDNQTALHYAVSCGHTDLAKLLVSRGIDQSVKDSEGNAAMDVASDDMKLFLRALSQQS